MKKNKPNTAKAVEENPDGTMGLTDHLRELRNRMVIIVISAVIGFVICFWFSARIVDFLVDVAVRYGYELVYLSPSELFLQYMKVGLIGAIVIMSPVILFQIWGFLKPGLTKKERKVLLPSLFFGLLCFIVGVAFAYFIMMPFMLSFFFNVNISQNIAASISVENYLNFILSISLTMGLVFELPVVIAILSLFGLVSPDLLKKGRKPAIVLIFIIGALITPPDITSQIMVAVPMIFLYQISITVSSIIYKNRKKKEDAEDDDDDDDDE